MQSLYAIFNAEGYLNDVVLTKQEAEDIIGGMPAGGGYISYVDWEWIPVRLKPGRRYHLIINRRKDDGH